MTIAIIGAGMAGAAAARHLVHHGRDVLLFDKARGPAGRLATRRHDGAGFDHGAPFVTASGGAFARFLHECVQNGTAAVWGEAGVELRIVGLPGMSALARAALHGCDVRVGFTATTITREADRWSVASAEGERAGGFEAVLVAIPAPQAEALLAPVHDAFTQSAREAAYVPCWTLMMACGGIDEAMRELPEGALTAEGIAALIHNGGKPGRRADTLVAHATARWSAERLEDEREAVAADLGTLVRDRLDLGTPDYVAAHRWRYARLSRVAARGPDYDAEAALGIAGDWCLGPDVEDAFHSGIALAERVLAAR